MRQMVVQDVQVIVLPDDRSSNKAKGALFEQFVGRLLAEEFGFEDPTTSNLNVTSDGVEIDVRSSHKLTSGAAIAECKAYTRNVVASELTNFYGKLAVERFDEPQTFGLMCALPRLTPDGEEKAREIESRDRNFKYLSAEALHAILLGSGVVNASPEILADTSDSAVLITNHGVFSACIALDADHRTPTGVAVWGSGTAVPNSVQLLLAESDYGSGLPVFDAGRPALRTAPTAPAVHGEVFLTTVAGSTSDFEYQLPASPKYFVGRRAVIQSLEKILGRESGSALVLNAQSGWGKSSLALKFHDLAAKRRGVGLVLDARTADDPRYVAEVLRKVANDAQAAGIIRFPEHASWASLESSLSTLKRAEWLGMQRPIVVFFDQFENVFRSAELTRQFRDLALGVRDIPGPLVVGFAWKTDLVGWTEGHPFQLRDDIRGAGQVLLVEPFGAREVDVILSRVAKQADVKLLPDLRARLRAYSQGLPWLLKKLADHVLKELTRGETQDDLVAESLNVVSLFEADLAELSPNEHTVLRHVARFAPIPAVEVTERFGPQAVQSLVDRRLLVQVGDRLDTYWDTFREFLNTGNVPIEESWILRQTPNSVGRLLPAVMDLGGDASVLELVDRLGTSDRGIFNLSRELRLLGVIGYAPNRVKVVDEVLRAPDQEAEMQRRVGAALRRHRAYSTFRKLADRSGGLVTSETYTRELPNAFPAVDVAPTAWQSYARAFLFWMEYAGMVIRNGSDYSLTVESAATPTVRLLAPRARRRTGHVVLQSAPGPAIELARRLVAGEAVTSASSGRERKAMNALTSLGLVDPLRAGQPLGVHRRDLLNADGSVNPDVLRSMIEATTGGAAALARLTSDPDATADDLGNLIASEAGVDWSTASKRNIGKYFRSWARLAG